MAKPTKKVAEPMKLDRLVWPAFLLATLIFYWTPLFDEQTTIQWDMVDVHYSAQKFFEQSVRTTGLPHWTPFVYSGMPFLADPQSAAWYPLHWPFFLIGITPRALEWEMALHAFLALCGAYLLARRFFDSMWVAVLAAVFYAWGGFFAGHSSHLGIFETAALLPWLLWGGLQPAKGFRPIALTGAIGGLIVLAGHFQTALYSFFALALVVAVQRIPWPRKLTIVAASALIAALIGAVQILPGLELTGQSVRAAADYSALTNAPLKPAALATLFSPNFYGVISNDYKGPGDITQFYFYQGILLIPLAALACIRWKTLWIPLALIVPALWYSLGPGAGLYSILTLLPGFKNVRAPVHIWFVIALGLALAAAAGSAWLADRFRRPWLVTALLIITVADLWYWNMSANPAAYGRSTYAELYGNAYDNYQSHLASIKQRPFYRIWSPYATKSFGPLNSSLEAGTEVTYGYNPLELARYAGYLQIADGNPRLLNGLGVTDKIDAAHGALVDNPQALGRVSVPPRIIFANDAAAARDMLSTLDPAQSAVVEAPTRTLDGTGAKAQIVNYQGDFYRVRYSAPADCLLRIAVPYFPGWTATADGHPASVLAVDYALSGVVVPAGDHELTFRYRSRWFLLGAALSALTAVFCLVLVLR